ncbi:hypothetical protein [Roseibacillus ishigakijimensis]|uniref:Uncharacterized protein n=1 Tax=Roseibacillus ishigakijimensis TaxID=454146 RepID=A0A934RRK3_9BACT|nr:hypothetical protein [Roseibacillus ishigakijimensis]MBK1834341.1 hypothetical protein [Roseibacillus ishigakijimensis]
MIPVLSTFPPLAQALASPAAGNILYWQIGCAGAGLLLGLLLMWLIMRAKFTALHARQEEQGQNAQSAIRTLEAKAVGLEQKLAELRHTEVLLLKRQGELEGMVTTQQQQQEEQKKLMAAVESRLAESLRNQSSEVLRETRREVASVAQESADKQWQELRKLLTQRQESLNDQLLPLSEDLQALRKRLEEISRRQNTGESRLQDDIEQLQQARSEWEASSREILAEVEKAVRGWQQPTTAPEKESLSAGDIATPQDPFAPLPPLVDGPSTTSPEEHDWAQLDDSGEESEEHHFEGFTLDEPAHPNEGKANAAADDLRAALEDPFKQD